MRVVTPMRNRTGAPEFKPTPTMLTAYRCPVSLAFADTDELMDMARTSVNVIGNCLAAVVIARWEGEFAETDITDFD